MKIILIVAAVAVVVVVRVALRRRRRGAVHESAHRTVGRVPLVGVAGLVAAREVRERVRGRPFRIGTALILLAVAAAIVIPTLNKGGTAHETVGVVGTLAPSLRAASVATASSLGIDVHIVDVASVGAARDGVSSGRLDIAIVQGRLLVVRQGISPTDSSSTAQLASALAQVLGVSAAYTAAGLTPAQIARVAGARPVHIVSLEPAPKHTAQGTSVVGVLLVFLMLSQYNAWILLGVMEEKASRVVEVLLAAVRPLQLLSGKVLGIGLVAMGQATVIVSFALVLARIVGSDLLKGSAPLVVASALCWLVLGYAFYCWVYAAAASMAERQEQVQSLAFPLSIPIIFGYVMSITVASTGNPSTLFRVLAFLPPTAPFAMPVMVGLHQVSWLGFVASVAISIACTVLVARAAAVVYRRAILRTGSKVRLRDVLRASH